MNFARIWVIAANCFQEVIRDRVLYFIGFFVLVLVIAMRLLPEISVGTHQKIFLDFGLGAIRLLSAIVAIFIGTGLINKEIEKRTVLVLIPKPISKVEFIVGKHLGLSAVLAVMVTVMTTIYLLLMKLSGISFALNTLIVSILYLLIELSLFISVSIMFGVFTSSILATLLSFAIYLMGNFSRNLVELGKISKNESVQFFTENLYLLLPDLSRLNLINEAAHGFLPEGIDLFNDALYGIVYTVLLLAIAILIFSRREF
jgi:ABC-type transport system involved in multi-copper enzyme maturation permease subunit